MRHRSMFALTLLATGAALTACGSAPPTASGGQVVPIATASTTPTPAAKGADLRSADTQGTVVEKIGERVRFGGANGVTFSIDSITVDPACSRYGERTAGMHTLLLHLRVAAGSDEDQVQRATEVINPLNFQTVGANGWTHDASIGACMDSSTSMLASQFDVNRGYDGVIELEVTDPHGALVVPADTVGGSGGWEWRY